MWYLDKSFIYILIIVLFSAGFNFLFKDRLSKLKKVLLSLAFGAFIFFYSKYLFVFIFAWIWAVFVLAKIIFHIQNDIVKKCVFIFSVGINVVVFVLTGVLSYDIANVSVIFLGSGYAFLKLTDVVYYAYYYEENFSFFDLVVFILFLPTFTSGPIMGFNDFKTQTLNHTPVNLESSVKRIVMGYFKKIVLLKIIYILHDRLLSGSLNPMSSLLVLFLFYIIGYLDFSGYSDIAIGFGKIMGFNVPENFRMPFLSPSLTVFWKNWHITLGAWVKSHITVFIKPKTRLQSALASFIIMVFIGLWHRFSLLFLLWGMWHGLVLFIEGYFNLAIVNKKKTKPVVYYLRCAITNLIVTIGCLFFYTDMGIVIKILKGFLPFLGN
jgi:alginate O-acetyltransferase complex protein AlgI